MALGSLGLAVAVEADEQVMVVSFQAPIHRLADRILNKHDDTEMYAALHTMADTSGRNHARYARHHGYQFRNITKWVDEPNGYDVCGGLSVIDTLLAPQRKNPSLNVTWILLIDGDVLIADPRVPISHFTATLPPQRQLVLASTLEMGLPGTTYVPDPFRQRFQAVQYRANPSMILVRANSWTRQFAHEFCHRKRAAGSMSWLIEWWQALNDSEMADKVALVSHDFLASPLLWSPSSFGVYFDVYNLYGSPICAARLDVLPPHHQALDTYRKGFLACEEEHHEMNRRANQLRKLGWSPNRWLFYEAPNVQERFHLPAAALKMSLIHLE
jgi:hypothetical protein